jgi:hypothetical protein
MDASKPDLKAKLKEWLGKQGYPLESAVTDAFRKRGFRVTPSHHFPDPKTGEQREIDVLATRQGKIDGRILRIVFVLECKFKADRPWVAVTDSADRPSASDRVSQRAASSHGKRLLEGFSNDPQLQNAGFFQMPARLAHNVTTALGNDNKDLAYPAYSKAAAATAGLVSVLRPSPVAAVLFPIVVIDGTLFETRPDTSGELEPEEVSKSIFLWRKPMHSAPYTVIHLVTREGLPELVQAATETADALFGLNPQRIGEVLGRPAGDIAADHPSIDF